MEHVGHCVLRGLTLLARAALKSLRFDAVIFRNWRYINRLLLIAFQAHSGVINIFDRLFLLRRLYVLDTPKLANTEAGVIVWSEFVPNYRVDDDTDQGRADSNDDVVEEI